jgi:hypothetical protein
MDRIKHAPKVTTEVATSGGQDGVMAESAE